LQVLQTTQVLADIAGPIGCCAGQTILSCRIADPSDKIPKQGGKAMPSQKLIIDGAGHRIQQQRAKEVNAALIDFLKGNAASR
jgi:pimeloyl-ACP methyl ester carboxylesterase